MSAHNNIAAAILAFTPIVYDEPIPAYVISESQMPMRIQENEMVAHPETDEAILSYHLLKQAFDISNTEMGKWLGVKRRSLYNWLNNPSSSKKYGKSIEERLSNLLKLKHEIEPEHLKFIYKIAFSPIYGNPKFGDDIYNGETGEVLIEWYESLYGKIESYRRISNKNFG